MIAALIAILFLGGGVDNSVLDYIAYMRGSVKEVVVDDERQADARATVQAMKKLTSAHTKGNQKAFKALVAEMLAMETDVEAVDDLWEEHFRAVEAYNEQMIDLRFELRETLTREEWEQMFGGSNE